MNCWKYNGLLFFIIDDIDLNVLVDEYGFKEYKNKYKRKRYGITVEIDKESRMIRSTDPTKISIADLYEAGLVISDEEIEWVPLI